MKMNTRRIKKTKNSICLIMIFLGLALSARSFSQNQILLTDTLIAYQEDGFWGDWVMSPVENWLSPTDYYNGQAFIRIEVFEKPDDTTQTSIILRIGSGKHHERAQYIRLGVKRVIFTKMGVHYFNMSIKDALPLTVEEFKWDSPMKFIQLVVADKNGQMISEWESDLGTYLAEKRNYLPLKIRYSSVLVPGGSKFKKPSWW
jgi:hypothetical protein